MNAVKYLLDTSALLALIEEETGADRVEKLLRQATTQIAAVSLMEVRYISLQEQGLAEANIRYALLKRSGAEIIWDLDEPTILQAANFKADYSVSFADALIAAYAQQQRAILVHKDPEFEVLAQTIQLEALPYKPSRG